MSIQIVYGTSGTGKSTYIFNQINEQIKQKSPYKIKVITPEQFSYTAEQKLLETSSSQSMISAEVITFARMAYRILGEVGKKTRINLSGSGKAMIIDHILLTENNKFSFLGKSDENVEMISRQLTELKKHQVQLDILKEVTKNTQDKYLQKKLEDITNLYDLYNNSIQNQYIDENDGLTLLAEELEESNEFKNCDIYIDEFAGFTLQEYEILRKLMRISHEITITICADNLQENTNADIDTFYSNKQTVKRILEIANQEQIEVEKPIFLNTPYRFKTEELQHLAENMASPFYKKYEKQNENLSIFLASNPYSEIENVAIQITKLAKKGYKYEEMAVITKNIDTYSSLCKAIFEQYNIPVFIDEKKELGSNILVRYVLSLLEIFAKNWSYESVFGYIKTGLLDLDTQEIAVLENYCLKWGIKGSKWYAKEWNFYNETEEQQKQIIYARDKVVEPLLKFKKQLAGLKTVKEITTGLYEFLVQNNIYEKLEQKIEELTSKRKNVKPSSTGVVVKGIDNCLVKLSRCCNPVPGDNIIGYITKGRGVSVHRTDCVNVKDLLKEEDRIIDVYWYTEEAASYNVDITVFANDRAGLLADVIQVLSNLKTKLIALNSKATKEHIATIEVTIEVENIEDLNKVLKELRKIDSVYEVTRKK